MKLAACLLLMIGMCHAVDAKETAGPPPGTVFKDCADCPEMVVIPSGSFQMGNDKDYAEKPAHRVTIQRFAVGKTEVTQGQWRAVMGNRSQHFGCYEDECPLLMADWNDAQEFVKQLAARTGKNYRLLSEAEWEYACRAGGQHEYCGSDNADGVGWHEGNSREKVHPVAGKQPNAWGLYDMMGNVSEWTQDCWHSDYNGAPVDGSAWETGECKRRVVRGGSKEDDPVFARSAYRDGSDAFKRYSSRGLRIAMSLSSSGQTSGATKK